MKFNNKEKNGIHSESAGSSRPGSSRLQGEFQKLARNSAINFFGDQKNIHFSARCKILAGEGDEHVMVAIVATD